ncbi:MAG: alpha/beta hydrolase [Planctomycetes bacterium]|nr:alpha/beta hydrolase [Planctomycetota bacterium]MCP4861189.1 alpha/beta hydrolase [Planctomycetota bacterium]
MSSTPPTRTDVVLIHGMWGCGNTLDPVSKPLQEAGYRTFQPTLPHHAPGLSKELRRELGKFGIPAYVAWLRDYLKGLDLAQPPILIGHSMGGLLAQHLAAEVELAGLVLLAPANPAGINCITPWGIVATSNALLHIVTRNPVQRPWRPILNLCLLNDLPAEQRAQWHSSFLLESTQSYKDIVFWFLQPQRPSAVPRDQCQCPVLVLGAAKDHLIRPGVVRRVAKRYPQATLEFMQKRGHMMFLDQDAHEVGARILAWFAEQQL